MTTTTRTDAEGKWESDDGTSWVLVEPTPAFTAERKRSADEQEADELATEVEQTNRTTLNDRADQALDGLRQITGSTGTLTGAQLSNAVRLLARVNIALVRLVIRRLEAED